jgi:ferrous iron transport protein A
VAERTIPLTQLATDEEGAVVALDGGTGLVSRLATLGFTPGAPVKMVQNYPHGPLIVRVRDTRIALGRGQAAKIGVRRRNGHGSL